MTTRYLPENEARDLRPGSEHYTAYVGPPKQYDFMGATQFRLLTTLGLREDHNVLDLGCGSLRAGRLLIPFLQPGHYCGIEPNQWLVDDGIANQLGQDILGVKKPRFDSNADFRCDVFGIRFDFMVAQSIFSHATPGLVAKALGNLRGSLAPNGLIVCTFVEANVADAHAVPEGWVYPGCVTYTQKGIMDLFGAAGLAACRIPWYHPRQAWYLAAIDPEQLPSDEDMHTLSGLVLRDSELRQKLVP